MSSFRRKGVTKKSIIRVYKEILRNGSPTVLDLRRSIPDYSSTCISKSANELCDMG